MTVATLRLHLRLLKCNTPRDARRLTRAIMDKLHRHFNVSVAEFEPAPGDDPAAAVLAVAAHPRVVVLGHAITEV